MIYNILEKTVYLKSRYELVTLLEDIQPVQDDIYSTMSLFKVVANNYENYMDICFPQVPYSEERLALFSHLYSNAGEMAIDVRRALVTNYRAFIWFALLFSGNNNRSFYEAELFGLFDDPDSAEENKTAAKCFNAPYADGQTYWQYIENCPQGYCACNYKNAYHSLCFHDRLKPIIQQVKSKAGISHLNQATLHIN